MPATRLSMRIIAAAVVLPALIAALDQFALGVARAGRWTEASGLLVFAIFAIQTFALAQAAGRWLPTWYWRLGVLCWALVLTNLQLFCAGCDGGQPNPGEGDLVRLLTNAFLSAQFDALILWIAIGEAALSQRLLLGFVLSVSPVLTAGLLTTYEVGYATVKPIWRPQAAAQGGSRRVAMN